MFLQKLVLYEVLFREGYWLRTFLESCRTFPCRLQKWGLSFARSPDPSAVTSHVLCLIRLFCKRWWTAFMQFYLLTAHYSSAILLHVIRRWSIYMLSQTRAAKQSKELLLNVCRWSSMCLRVRVRSPASHSLFQNYICWSLCWDYPNLLSVCVDEAI